MSEKKAIRRYDRALLDECMKRDGATLIGEYDKLSREIIIKFRCSCGENGSRYFRMLEKLGTYCEKCAKINKKNKTLSSNLVKYGVEHPLQNKEIIDKVINTNLEKYGVKSTSQVKEIREKQKETCIKKYGVEYPQQNKNIRNKTIHIFKEKYGIINPSQNNDFQKKKIDTNLIKFGVEWASQNAEVKEKIKNTNIEKYGVENPNQTNEVREKIKNTNLIKYGVEYPLQSKEIMEKTQKNAKKYKKYKMPSGEIRKVQGYEPFALDTLLKTYTEDQIKTDRKDVPCIQYEVESKKKYYFPDIFIPHENKLIEVKSTWTYKCKTDNIHQKADACKAQGYNYEIWCYDAKGNRVEI